MSLTVTAPTEPDPVRVPAPSATAALSLKPVTLSVPSVTVAVPLKKPEPEMVKVPKSSFTMEPAPSMGPERVRSLPLALVSAPFTTMLLGKVAAAGRLRASVPAAPTVTVTPAAMEPLLPWPISRVPPVTVVAPE